MSATQAAARTIAALALAHNRAARITPTERQATMLYPEKVIAALAAKRDAFASYERRHGEQLAAYRAALADLGRRYPTASGMVAAQNARAEATGSSAGSGAHPTEDYDAWHAQARGAHGSDIPRWPFAQTFAHHEEARAWAERLRGTATIAVDGSQLLPWRDVSMPIALVQAGIFENPHQPPRPYLKDVVLELLTPDDLAPLDGDVFVDVRSGDELGYSERAIALRRFELETRTLGARLATHAPATGPDNVPAVALADGSLLVPFALKMPGEYRERYLDAVQRLVGASRQARVPLVGYIDTTYARDVTRLLKTLFPDLPDPRGVHDALLWSGRLGWGERSPAFLAARADHSNLANAGSASVAPGEEIAFVLFQAALDRPPARIEFPRWVLDAGLLDAVLDVVRCEVIVGNGYPYPIEAADAVAVISAPDRARFYGLLQQFAEREGIALSFSRKALSKSLRRV